MITSTFTVQKLLNSMESNVFDSWGYFLDLQKGPVSAYNLKGFLSIFPLVVSVSKVLN